MITVCLTHTHPALAPTFNAMYHDCHSCLNRGTELGRMTGVMCPDINVHNYSEGGEIECCVVDPTAAFTEVMLVWLGNPKMGGDPANEPLYNDLRPYDPQLAN